MLLHALRSPGNMQALAQVRQHAEAISDALDALEEDLPGLDELVQNEARQQWLSQVYAAMGAEDPGNEQEQAMAAAMEALRNDQDREVGEAVSLLVSEFPWLGNWSEHFPDLRPADRSLREHLAMDASVQAAGAVGQQLLALGLTPSMFVQALRGFQLMFDRVVRSLAHEGPDATYRVWSCAADPSTAWLQLPDGSPLHIPVSAMNLQMGGVMHLPAEQTDHMAKWVLAAASQRPTLVAGYVYDSERQLFKPAAPQQQAAAAGGVVAQLARPRQTYA
jgi:hypothetical protein